MEVKEEQRKESKRRKKARKGTEEEAQEEGRCCWSRERLCVCVLGERGGGAVAVLGVVAVPGMVVGLGGRLFRKSEAVFHRCVRSPRKGLMTAADVRPREAQYVRPRAKGGQQAVAVREERGAFDFLLRTGGRQHAARGDAAEDFDEMLPARLLAMRGQDHQALAAYERVAAQRAEDPRRGPHHPETLRAHMSLGNYQRETGRTGAAVDSYRAVLDGRMATLGPRHPDTLATRFALAGLLKDLKELGAAVKEYEETVAGYDECLGERHTATLDAKYGLAILLQQQHALKNGGKKPAEQLTGMAKIRAEKELRERNAAAKRQHETGAPAPGEDEDGRVQKLYESVVAGYSAQLGPRHTGPLPCGPRITTPWPIFASPLAELGCFTVIAETLRAQYNLALCLKQNGQLGAPVHPSSIHVRASAPPKAMRV